MEIKPPSNELYTTIKPSVSAASQNNVANRLPTNWKISQLLDAIIIKMTDKHLFLDIKGVKANTLKPTNISLNVGDTLKLQVEQLKPMPQFRIIRFQSPSTNNITSSPSRNIHIDTSPLKSLIKDINFVATRPALRPAPLTADTNVAVRDLFKQLPSLFNLKDATQIKNQLQNSGIFIENKIKNKILSSSEHLQVNKTINPKTNLNIKPLLDADIGVQLHRIADHIRTHLSTTKNENYQPIVVSNNKILPQKPAPNAGEQPSLQNITQRDEAMFTFLRKIESSLNHMQQTQLQNLNESQVGRPHWLMELPIKNGQELDLFELHIEQDEAKQTDDKSKKIWNVTLKFDIAGLGKIKAHITMQNEHISTQFYSEKPKILSLFRENFDFLRNRLNINGLNVDKIDCARANLSNNNQSALPEFKNHE